MARAIEGVRLKCRPEEKGEKRGAEKRKEELGGDSFVWTAEPGEQGEGKKRKGGGKGRKNPFMASSIAERKKKVEKKGGSNVISSRFIFLRSEQKEKE